MQGAHLVQALLIAKCFLGGFEDYFNENSITPTLSFLGVSKYCRCLDGWAMPNGHHHGMIRSTQPERKKVLRRSGSKN